MQGEVDVLRGTSDEGGLVLITEYTAPFSKSLKGVNCLSVDRSQSVAEGKEDVRY